MKMGNASKNAGNFCWHVSSSQMLTFSGLKIRQNVKNVEHGFLPLSEMSAWKFFYNIPKLLYQQLRY